MSANQGERRDCGHGACRYLLFWVASCLLLVLDFSLNAPAAMARGPASLREKQAAVIRKRLESKPAKAYHGREVHPSQRWYVIMLRDNTVVVTIPAPGLRLWKQERTVSYVKVQGIEPAVAEILRFLEGTPGGHVRDFDARYCLFDSQANTIFSECQRAPCAAGAQPVLSDSDTTGSGQ